MAGFRNAVRAVIAAALKDRLVLVWSLLLVVLATGACWVWGQDREADQVASARTEALSQARTKVATVLSYNFRTVDADIAASTKLLTGDAKKQFESTTAQWVVPASHEARITNTAEVSDAGVIAATEDRVETLVFVTQTTVSKGSKEPKISGTRLAVTMTRVGDSWLISILDPIGTDGGAPGAAGKQ